MTALRPKCQSHTSPLLGACPCLPVISTFSVLLVAKAEGIIPTVKPILDALQVHGARISQPPYRPMPSDAYRRQRSRRRVVIHFCSYTSAHR